MSLPQDLEDLRATLTPEERAAIDDTGDEPDKAALQAVAGETQASPDDDEADDETEGGSADVGAAAADAAPAAPAAPASETQASPDAAPAKAAGAVDEADEGEPPPVAYRLPEDYQQQLDTHKAAVSELRRRRDEGEISNAEYDAEYDKLSEQADALRGMRVRSEVAADQQRQYEQRQVNTAWKRTLDAAKADGIDYTKDTEKHGDFDTFIKALAAKPENQDKPLRWFFAEAHRRVMALHGVTGQAPAAPAPAAQSRAAGKPAAASRAPDLSALPKDLSQVPGGAAGAGDLGDDEFVDIDSLEGLEYEDALAKMAARDPNFTRKFTAGLKGHRAARH